MPYFVVSRGYNIFELTVSLFLTRVSHRWVWPKATIQQSVKESVQQIAMQCAYVEIATPTVTRGSTSSTGSKTVK